jgi:hypothetical protein
MNCFFCVLQIRGNNSRLYDAAIGELISTEDSSSSGAIQTAEAESKPVRSNSPGSAVQRSKKQPIPEKVFPFSCLV